MIALLPVQPDELLSFMNGTPFLSLDPHKRLQRVRLLEVTHGDTSLEEIRVRIIQEDGTPRTFFLHQTPKCLFHEKVAIL